MGSISTRSLRDDLSFGSAVSGVTMENSRDPELRARINRVFEERGVILFEDVEPTSEMQMAISAIFGPLKEHPVKTVARVNQDLMPGVIELKHDPNKGSVVELDGRALGGWLPWHFDHCYNDELNRAGVLRAVTIPPEGGETGFADGIELYKTVSPELLAKFEDLNIIYSLDLLFAHMKFGRPANFREIIPQAKEAILAAAKQLPRALHPAVWTRASGEKVLHMAGWHAWGIEHHEDPAGEALLVEMCEEINRKANPYIHKWRPTDMIIWDNWRVLHMACGCDPVHPRQMHRATIKGDYGLCRFEGNQRCDTVVEMM